MNYTANHKKGQALLFAVVAVTIALSIGIAASSRNLKSLSNTSRVDTSARVYAAAEGGIERFLQLPDSALDVLSANATKCGDFGFTVSTDTNYSGYCQIKYTPDVSIGDKIIAQANVKVERFKYNSKCCIKASLADACTSSNTFDCYTFKLEVGQVKEISLFDPGTHDRYSYKSIKMCWQNPESAIYYYSYGDDYTDPSDLRSGGYRPASLIFPNVFDTNLSSDTSYKGYTSTNSAPDGSTFNYCNNKAVVDTPLPSGDNFGLRIKALFASTEAGVIPEGNDTLPVQGYKITSIGTLVKDGSIIETRKVVVYRSEPYMPTFLDYAIYSPQEQIN